MNKVEREVLQNISNYLYDLRQQLELIRIENTRILAPPDLIKNEVDDATTE